MREKRKEKREKGKGKREKGKEKLLVSYFTSSHFSSASHFPLHARARASRKPSPSYIAADYSIFGDAASTSVFG
jgi:hypothetical protein